MFKKPAQTSFTSRIAHAVTSPAKPNRRHDILRALSRGPLAIFEVARLLDVHDHQIAGRFGEMREAKLIARNGTTKDKPSTGCPCDVYCLTEAGEKLLAQLSDE